MAVLVAQFLRDRAWWRLDSAGASAPRPPRAADRTGPGRPRQPGHAPDQRPPPGSRPRDHPRARRTRL